MIREAILHLVFLTILLVGIVGSFKLYQSYNPVKLEQGDSSMGRDFEPGSYNLEPRPRSVESLQPGRAIAYKVPNDPGLEKIGWVIGLPGDLVAVKDRTLTVNGRAPQKEINFRKDLPAFLVPKGCVCVFASNAGEDSSKYGPIPFLNVLGLMKK